MLGKMILAGIALVVGFVLITPVKDILGRLLTIMNNTVPMSDFDYMIWLVMPLVLLVFIFVGAVWIFRHNEGDGEE